MEDEEIIESIYKYVAQNIKYEDYHIFNMKIFCIEKNNKKIIQSIIDYSKDNIPHRKIFENTLN